MPEIQIMPSILAADKGRLADECKRAEDAGSDGLHIDIMDGHFVPNLSFGPDFVAMAKEAVSIHLSVHLMVTRPDQLVKAFLDAGSDTLQIHVEADCDPIPVLQQIRDHGVRAGIVLNPATPVQPVLDLEGHFDEILCMTVNPGFGGQAFIRSVLPKMQALRKALPAIDMSVDGGVTGDTAVECARAGCNILIAGSYLYRAPDMTAAIQDMRTRGTAAWLDA